MKSIHRAFTVVCAIFAASAAFAVSAPRPITEPKPFDLVVYGGTPAGIVPGGVPLHVSVPASGAVSIAFAAWVVRRGRRK
jgi:hypothetical protein